MRRFALILCFGFALGCESDGDKEDESNHQAAGGAAQSSSGVGGAHIGTLSTRVATPGGSAGQATGVDPGASKYWGEQHTGSFWIGPVDYAETKFHNGCAPSVKYPAGIQQLYGRNIMGLANEMTLEGLSAGDGQLCDTCAELSANGRTLIAHVVTFGQETGPNDIDVSVEVDSALQGGTSRSLTWRFVSCPTATPIQYTFDGRQWSNTWFFRVWIRNARVPVSKLEYRIGAGSWTPATWQSDGAFQASGSDFGSGFALRVTSLDLQSIEDTIPGLNTFDPDAGIASHGNFQ